MQYVGFDIHKKTISWCAKLADGTVTGEGRIPASRRALDGWMKGRSGPWIAAMEATLFTSWVYEHLLPHAQEVKVAHPAMLKAIAASKRKNDRIDAAMIADLLRCNLLPECYMAPPEIRELRRTLRYRSLLVRQRTQIKNRMSGLLMEAGVEYNKQKLHQKRYFHELLQSAQDLPESLIPLLRLSRMTVETSGRTEKQLLRSLVKDPRLLERVDRLQTIPAVGPVTALTWALEIGEVKRFRKYKQAVSYCGLCGSENSSAGVQKRTPLSKQRNSHLQTVLIEAAKLGPRHSPELAAVHARALEKGNRNEATLAVARKLVAWLLAVDRRQTGFRRNTETEGRQAA
jgi:transposase